MRLICPAAFGLPPRMLALGQYGGLRRGAIEHQLAQPVSITTADRGAAKLDALWLRRRPGSPRPLVVVSIGFAMSYQSILPGCLAFCQALDVEVLLYNGRGIGRSSGVPRSPLDAVWDARAALRWALERRRKVAAYGISMGAAWMVLAAQAMATAGELPPGGLGLVVLARCFGRLTDVVAAHLGGAAGRGAQRLLARADFPPIDLVAALGQKLPAEQVVVAQAAGDRIVPPSAQLGEQLQLPRHCYGLMPSGQSALYLPDLGQGHLDRRFRSHRHDALIRAWAATDAP